MDKKNWGIFIPFVSVLDNKYLYLYDEAKQF